MGRTVDDFQRIYLYGDWQCVRVIHPGSGADGCEHCNVRMRRSRINVHSYDCNNNMGAISIVVMTGGVTKGFTFIVAYKNVNEICKRSVFRSINIISNRGKQELQDLICGNRIPRNIS